MNGLLLAVLLLMVPDGGIREWRGLYAQASASAEALAKLEEALKRHGHGHDPIHQGYSGAALMLRSLYAKEVREKVALFKEGASLLETAIAQRSGEPELIFLRYTVQTSAPPAVKYSSSKEKDLPALLAFLRQPDGDSHLKAHVRNYLLLPGKAPAEVQERLK